MLIFQHSGTGRNAAQRVIGKAAAMAGGVHDTLFLAGYLKVIDHAAIGTVGAARLDILAEWVFHLSFPLTGFR